jgi:hypothetical protein
LIGTWEGRGELFGRPAAFSMEWSWVLEGQVAELRFENRLVQDDGTEQTVLRAVALYLTTDDESLSGSWYDTRGQAIDLAAQVTEDAISTHWTAASEEGRTTYRVVGETVEVDDQVLRDGTFHPFGKATYRRAKERPPVSGGDAMTQANGTFEVKMNPLGVYNESPEAKIARMSIDKTFAGDLEATSQGEMVSGGSPAEGSAGYVAMERVTGSLHGKQGSFLLQHSGTMTPEAQELTISVVPASGTGELEGLSGRMEIRIEDGAHSYVFDYSLPDS